MRVRVPGDKSLTQRALILSALADGESRISGLLYGGDADSTAGALRALGVSLPPIPSDGSAIRVTGVGLRGLQAPGGRLDLGNSGTGARLLMGVLAGRELAVTIDGDDSLRSRPMRRVSDPLAVMGARFEYLGDDGRLPVRVVGRRPLGAVDWPSPVASAQVKSAILLAGLTGGALAVVTEPRQSRDHTERMLGRVGARVVSHAVEGGWRVELRDPPDRIDPLDFEVPGDVSSAAFVLALAVLGGTSEPVIVERTGLNPTRTAFLDVLLRMGADVAVSGASDGAASEPIGDVTASASELHGTEVGADEVPRMIDELPLVAVLGAAAAGETRITGAEELRAKESDRIDALVRNLRALDVEVEERPDGLVVRGTDRPVRGTVRSFGDHRIAMAFSVLGAVGPNRIDVRGAEASDVSFPSFRSLLDRLGSGATGA